MEFVVWDTEKALYVESVDTYDGSTERTRHREQARIFRGETWVDFWKGDRYKIVRLVPTFGEV